MEFTKIQKIRYNHLIDFGVDFKKLSESLQLSMDQTIQFMTESFTYNRFLYTKKNSWKEENSLTS